MDLTASGLRSELIARANTWTVLNGLERYSLRSRGGVVAFQPCVLDGWPRHGNFEPDSYAALLAREDWAPRLLKPHAQRSAFPPEVRDEVFETDSCTSSDALLMSIVAHPGMETRVGELLGGFGGILFGAKAKVPLEDGLADATELDLALISEAGPSAIAEAKLTEGGFTSKPEQKVRRYRDFEEVFHVDRLPRTKNGDFRHYQLIRNVLAAHHLNSEFTLLHDRRRVDLHRYFHEVRQSIREKSLASRCHALAWQELIVAGPPELLRFSSMKYGIEAQRVQRGI